MTALHPVIGGTTTRLSPQAKMGATGSPPPDLGAMPEWNLADLYAAPNAAEVERDFAAAAAEAKRIKATYQGKLGEIARDGAALAAAVKAYEQLSELMGRLASYASLLYAGDRADPQRAKFYGDTSEKITGISANLIFFELELNKI